MARKLVWVWTAVLSLAATASYSQDGLLEELYGRGVHLFFAGRMGEAFDSLNTAIRDGSRDPRAFYYRGLVQNRMGRPDEAKADFLHAAMLEAQGGIPYSVGRALERIQGPERTMLETHRRNARIALHASQTSRDRARYEQIRRSEGEMLRAAPPAPPASATPPAVRPDSSDPFAPPPAPLPSPAPAPAAPAPAPVPPPSPDPFATPPAEAPPAQPLPAEATPATPPATPAPAPAPDPFAEPPTTPAPTPVPALPAPSAPPPSAPPPVPPANDPFAPPPAAP